ncbi:CDP-diacylglycerol--serine O-phosphatidyltransferase [bacterium endosymbiont of Pedicinus badii]|uniref:CDP-diacylglycerol--serine O-phosphatidyltransferase n=1 Tax=bacterium endosymbiont of Pedicinus badii TaxID=1719126 RepID=UPI0009B9A6AC|nr:CDP-diacylglycerol--serine O-phosphatidyltransferase [bacterium endosymbiont of Pedicinus badii]OQM34503.1 hypothetical protein AOQ89_01285 [bacterium endosymbiont of Pedicinus badii]
MFKKKIRRSIFNIRKIPQNYKNITTLYKPIDFFNTLINSISNAKKRIYLTVLYLEKDKGGRKVLESLYRAKMKNPNLEIAVLLDFHRAKRNRFGSNSDYTNSDWYKKIANHHLSEVPIYGVPISYYEAFGIFHLKGCIIDDFVIYSGASFSEVYLAQNKKSYRYDRYKIIKNKHLSDAFSDYLKIYFLSNPAVIRLNILKKYNFFFQKHKIKVFKKKLKQANYKYLGCEKINKLGIIPLVGIGKNSFLNKIIQNLIFSAKKKIIISTPYFNFPKFFIQNILNSLKKGKKVKIIVGDKTANDFYISEEKNFRIVGILPYLYENNLRKFIMNLQEFVQENKLTIKIWKNGENTYHAKGLWIDEEWQMFTGSNFNSRSWKLDLENAILVHDPEKKLKEQNIKELKKLEFNTKKIMHFSELQNIYEYPERIKNILLKVTKTKIDYFLKKII